MPEFGDRRIVGRITIVQPYGRPALLVLRYLGPRAEAFFGHEGAANFDGTTLGELNFG